MTLCVAVLHSKYSLQAIDSYTFNILFNSLLLSQTSPALFIKYTALNILNSYLLSDFIRDFRSSSYSVALSFNSILTLLRKSFQ